MDQMPKTDSGAVGTPATVSGTSTPPVAPVPATLAQRLASRSGLLTLIALAAAALVLWVIAGRATPVKIAVAKRGTAAEVIYATGAVEPVRWAKVVSLQRKRIIWTCAECEGKPVKQGQELARLDDVEERAQLAELEARLKRIQEDAARIESLVARNVTARTTYDEKLTQVREYEAKVAAQRDRVTDLVLRAPMDGIVLRRDGEVGEIAGVGNADVLFWIGEPKPMRVVADVSEDDIPKVKEGQTVLLRHDAASGQPLSATVASITPKGDPQSKTFRVYLALPADSPLRIGMSVEANIIAREVKDTLVVPTDALSGNTVEIVENGRIARRTVTTGIRGTSSVEIKSGLDAGQSVVTPFSATMKDGARVRTESAGTP